MRFTEWEERKNIRCSSSKKNCNTSNREKGKQGWHKLPRLCRHNESGKGFYSFLSQSEVEKTRCCCENITQRVVQTRSLSLCFIRAREKRRSFCSLDPPKSSHAQILLQLAGNCLQRPFLKINQLCSFHYDSAIKFCVKLLRPSESSAAQCWLWEPFCCSCILIVLMDDWGCFVAVAEQRALLVLMLSALTKALFFCVCAACFEDGPLHSVLRLLLSEKR